MTDLPEPVAYGMRGLKSREVFDCVSAVQWVNGDDNYDVPLFTTEQLQAYGAAEFARAVELAIDLVQFHGGTVHLEAHIRALIKEQT